MQAQDEEMEDNFNASFESVKRDNDEVSINASYSDKMSEIKLKHEFNVHLDSVRGVRFIRSLDCMASVSEDCTVKLWDVKLMHKNMEDGFGQGIDFKGDPYFTLRGHTGPLFKITGSCIDDRIIYTAGIEGTVKIWKVPDVDDVDIFGQEQDKYNFCLGTLNGHNNEPIWDLRHHPSLPMLLSMGADDSL
jgi:WD40 repeat protein